MLRPGLLGSYHGYGMKYCTSPDRPDTASQQGRSSGRVGRGGGGGGRGGYPGQEYTGSNNLVELHMILTANVMIRREKAQVKLDLPDKIRTKVCAVGSAATGCTDGVHRRGAATGRREYTGCVPLCTWAVISATLVAYHGPWHGSTVLQGWCDCLPACLPAFVVPDASLCHKHRSHAYVRQQGRQSHKCSLSLCGATS